jgi:hypothetical protein
MWDSQAIFYFFVCTTSQLWDYMNLTSYEMRSVKTTCPLHLLDSRCPWCDPTVRLLRWSVKTTCHLHLLNSLCPWWWFYRASVTVERKDDLSSTPLGFPLSLVWCCLCVCYGGVSWRTCWLSEHITLQVRGSSPEIQRQTWNHCPEIQRRMVRK